MKLNRTRPFALALSLAAAAVVFAADTTPKKKPAAPAKPAAKPTQPAEPAPADAKAPADKPAAAPKAAKPDPKADEVVATVDGVAIKSGEVDSVIREMMAQRGMPPDALPESQRAGVVRMVLDNMILERVMKAASAGFKVTDAEVDEELKKIRDREQVSEEEMKKQIAAAGKTLANVKTEIRDGMQVRKWMDDQLKDKVKDATEAEAKDFYEKNPQHFEEPSQVRASHILFMVEANAAPDAVSAAQKKAEAATVRAQKEDFAKLAGELSEEPGAKERGGDLNFFPAEGVMVKEFADAAFKLKKGEISAAPVRSQFGFHVIKVTDRKEGKKQPFEEAKVKITSYLTGQKKETAARDVVASLKEKAKIDIKLPPPPALVKPPQASKPEAATDPVTAPPAPARKPVEAVTPPVTVPPEPAKDPKK
jgi:parvulin-like peptidyl-prolyl isomerase